MASVWILIGLGAALSFFAGVASELKPFLLFLIFYSLYAAWMHFLGVVLQGGAVWVPHPLIPKFPIIEIGRKRIATGKIHYVMSLGKCGGFEAVEIDTVDILQRVLFSNRKQRLAFLGAIKAFRPETLIYKR